MPNQNGEIVGLYYLAIPGRDISKVIDEMCKLSKKRNKIIFTLVNNTLIFTRPNDKPEVVTRKYCEKVGLRSDFFEEMVV